MTTEIKNNNEMIDMNAIISGVIDRNIDKIINAIGAKCKDFKTKGDLNLKSTYKEYIEKSYAKYSKMRTLLYKEEPVYVYDFYEPVDIKYKKKKLKSCTLNDLTTISNTLVITGLGGCGKSTFLKHLFVDSIRTTKLIPIFIELKEINGTNKSLIDLIYHGMKNNGFNLQRDYYEHAFKSGTFLFLFDGIDEVDDNNKIRVLREINELTDRFIDNTFILTSRPSEDLYGLTRYYFVEALELSKKQAISLVSKLDYDLIIRNKFVSQLKKGLYASHQSFASNPLLLTIMLLTYENYAEIPDKLHIFYSNAFDTMFFKHDALKGVYKREIKCKLAINDFKTILSQFCFYTYLQEMFDFSHDELFNILTKCKNRYSYNFEVENYISDLQHSICLLINDGSKFKFVHRSFQEYFAAYYVTNLNDENQKTAIFNIAKMNRNSKKGENIIPIIQDILGEKYIDNIILPLLEVHEERAKNCVDRYKYFFTNIANGIALLYRTEVDHVFDLVYMGTQIGNSSDIKPEIKQLLYDFASKNIDYKSNYGKDGYVKSFNTIIDIVKEYAVRNLGDDEIVYIDEGDLKMYLLDINQITDNEELYEFIKKTHYNLIVEYLSKQYKILKADQVRRYSEFEELFI